MSTSLHMLDRYFSVMLLSKIPTFIYSVRDNCNCHRTQPYMIQNCGAPIITQPLKKNSYHRPSRSSFELKRPPAILWQLALTIVDFKAMLPCCNLFRNEAINYKLQIYVVCIIEQLSYDSYQIFDLFS